MSGGLAIEWNERTVKALNLSGMESVLGLNFLALDLGVSFTIFNIYGPYLNRIPFWDALLSNHLIRGDSLILGGDLNFSLGQDEVWGTHAHAVF